MRFITLLLFVLAAGAVSAHADSLSEPLSVAVTPGSGASRSVTIGMSEDAFQGDAQYAIAVDGTQVTTGTATSPHGGGSSQFVTLQVDEGPHRVVVTFANDEFEGSNSRSLYVDRVDLPGYSLRSSTKLDFNQGSYAFGVPQAGAGPVRLPQPYPLQPGFTAISSLSQTNGPGSYQLIADDPSVVNIGTGITLDGGGHSTGLIILTTAANNANIRNVYASAIDIDTGAVNVTIDNFQILSTIFSYSGITISRIVIGETLVRPASDDSRNVGR
jgi:hypothetical protein